MQSYTVSIANTVAADMVAKADGTPITTGTVTFYLIAKTGANAGKWFQTSDDSWQVAEAAAGAGSHTSDGHWTCSIDAAAWLADTRYSLYAKESGDLHIPYSEEVCDPILSNVTQISGDATAADNLELMYDGTGYVADSAPASRSQVANLVTTGAATNKIVESVDITTGSETGTYANTAALDGVYHQIDIAGDEIDLYYEFDIGATGVPVSVTLQGRLYDNPVDDSLSVYAYDWDATGWSQIGTLHSVKTSDESYVYTLFTNHVGDGTDNGKVRIRFYDTDLHANTVLRIDQLYCSYATVGSTVGYAMGRIWVDTINGVAGSVAHVNGTADNPVDSWADALTLAASLKIYSFNLSNGSEITLTADSSYYSFIGAATIHLDSNVITHAHFEDIELIDGISSGDDAEFHLCGIGTATIAHAHFLDCNFSGTFTSVADDDYFIMNGTDTAGGAASQVVFVFKANVEVLFRDYNGGLEIQDMDVTNNMIIDGAGRLDIDASCTAGSITLRGFFPRSTGGDAFETAGGTLTDDQTYSEELVADAVWDESSIAHGDSGTVGNTLATVDANVDSILTDTGTTIPATITTLQGTATKLEGMIEIDGAVYKFTANALEEAPSGTGGDATAANQTAIIEDLEDVKGTGFVKDTNSLVDLTATTPINVTVETTVVE